MQNASMHFNLFEPKLLPLSQVVEDRNYEFPTFQRNFVWRPKDIQCLIDSIYKGIPINSIYLWESSGILTKRGDESNGETKLVIDGQQRLTALRAVLLGKTYRNERGLEKEIRYAFHPVKGTFHQVDSKFKDSNAVISNLAAYYADPESATNAYWDANDSLTEIDQQTAEAHLEQLKAIKTYPVVVYMINDKVDINIAYECFERTNQGGKKVSPANICMAWLETYQPLLAEGIVRFAEGIQFDSRKAASRPPSRRFEQSIFDEKLRWLRMDHNRKPCYQPKTEHVVELLFHLIQGGKKFQIGNIAKELLREETEVIGSSNGTSRAITTAENAFLSMVNQKNYNRFEAIITRFPNINATDKNYAYWLYLQCVADGKKHEEITRLIQRWYLLNLMSSVRTSGKVAFSRYLDGFTDNGGLEGYLEGLETDLKPESWEQTLPAKLEGGLSTRDRTPIIKAWEFTQILNKHNALFDSNMLIENLDEQPKLRSEHHIYPQVRLNGGHPKNVVDAVANIAITTGDINSSIGDSYLDVYIEREQAENRLAHAASHLRDHCIPEGAGTMNYTEFLTKRAEMMARRFKETYFNLKG